MPLSYGQEPNLVNKGDTAEVEATVYDRTDTPYAAVDLDGVEFTVQAPDGTQDVVTGTIQDDGTGYLAYNVTDQVGEYVVAATFTTVGGLVRSTRADFEVLDPFGEGMTATDVVVNGVAMRLEDCFDSEMGGPWLRDQTMRYFNRNKIAEFVSEGLLDISLAPPLTEVTVDGFVIPATDTTPVTATSDTPLLIQATLIAVIRHLMRSYVEIYTPQGTEITWLDRTQYLQRWGIILQAEVEQFTRRLALWKRQFLNLGHSKLLVGGRSASPYYTPGFRIRNSRGWGY